MQAFIDSHRALKTARAFPGDCCENVTAPSRTVEKFRQVAEYRRRPFLTHSGRQRLRIAARQTDPEPHFAGRKSLL